VVPWGKLKGTAVTELKPDQLDYYEKKAREAIADPEKAKWKAREQKWLDAVLAERTRRAAPAKAAEPPKTNGKTAGTPPAKGEPAQQDWTNVGPPPMTDAEIDAAEKAKGM
jgi:hypothetical protein